MAEVWVQLNFRLWFRGKYKSGKIVKRKFSVQKHFPEQVTILLNLEG